ncbi:MAG: hypothetical protein M3Y72_12180 [Acidobacteriota bacterium]|nr:hypothetical protein [Acidobacteriota bacterium]
MLRTKSNLAFLLVAAFFANWGSNPSNAQSLYHAPSGVETRWASPENPQGLKGQGAQTNGGRKGRPFLLVKGRRTSNSRGSSQHKWNREKDLGDAQRQKSGNAARSKN